MSKKIIILVIILIKLKKVKGNKRLTILICLFAITT